MMLYVTVYTYPSPKSGYAARILSDARFLGDLSSYPKAGRRTEVVVCVGTRAMDGAYLVVVPPGCKRAKLDAATLGAFAPVYGMSIDPTIHYWIVDACAASPFEGARASAAPIVAAKRDGCSCRNCGEFFPYAEPNQPDGTLVCYCCRQDPYRCRF